MINFSIVESGITVGRFGDKADRDKAFKAYFLKKDRNGYKTEVQGG